MEVTKVVFVVVIAIMFVKHNKEKVNLIVNVIITVIELAVKLMWRLEEEMKWKIMDKIKY